MAGGNSVDFFHIKRHSPKPVQAYIGMGLRWAPSLFGFGAFGGMMFLYFTDWKIFMDKVPIYRKKFEEKETII